MADDVADDEGDAGAGERDDVVPVAADAGLGAGGQVAGGDVHGGGAGEVMGEEAVLEGEGGGALAGVAAGVVEADSGVGGELVGEQEVVGGEGSGVAVAGEDSGAESGAPGP